VAGERNINMDHWWIDTDRERLKYLERNPFMCRIVRHETQMSWPGTVRRFRRVDVGG